MGLHGDIEGRDRLVGDDEAWGTGDRPGDADRLTNNTDAVDIVPRAPLACSEDGTWLQPRPENAGGGGGVGGLSRLAGEPLFRRLRRQHRSSLQTAQRQFRRKPFPQTRRRRLNQRQPLIPWPPSPSSGCACAALRGEA